MLSNNDNTHDAISQHEPDHSTSFLDSIALSVFTTPSMWLFFAFINVFMGLYIGWQEWGFDRFDLYPFPMLNLILAVFVAEMDVIIVIAQIVASNKAEGREQKTAELVVKTDLQTALLVESMEGSLVTMRALEDMGKRESERDAELHALIKEGQGRLVVMERLIRELIEDRKP